jgi:peptidoglycan/LPS O-acetylase OafA/YrhL
MRVTAAVLHDTKKPWYRPWGDRCLSSDSYRVGRDWPVDGLFILAAGGLALYFAVRDPRVPWYAKALAACVVAYACSPIDLIPDHIPMVGYPDDLVLIPLGILAVRARIPEAVVEESV